MAIGLSIEVLYAGSPVASAKFFSPAGSIGGVTLPVPLHGHLETLRNADPNDPNWTVRVRGDGEMALRDFSATKYWAGEFTLPLKDVLK
jgi:hypothetical protein